MYKKLIFLTLFCTHLASQTLNSQSTSIISHELSKINQTLINNQPVIDGNINRSINSIQQIITHDDVYDYQQELDQHFMNLEAAIEGASYGDITTKAQSKANLAFLRRILHQNNLPRSLQKNLLDRLKKLGRGTFNGLFGAFLAGYATLGIQAIISKQDTNIPILLSAGSRHGALEAGIVINPSKIESYTKRTLACIPFLFYAGISTPFLYIAAKAFKRLLFFNEHLNNREICIKQYIKRELELEKNI